MSDGISDMYNDYDRYKALCLKWKVKILPISGDWYNILWELKEKRKTKIKNKICKLTPNEYIQLKASGMFWELYPEAAGNYVEDCKLSHEGKFKIEKDL